MDENQTTVAPTSDELKTQTEAATQNSKDLQEKLKEAKQYVVDCKAAVKQMAVDDPNLQTGKDAIVEGEASVAQLTADLAASRQLTKDLKERTKEVRAAEREAAKAAKAAPKVERVSQNGQTAPAAGTVGATLWSIFDAVSAEKGAPAAFAEVLPKATEEGVKEASTRAGYAHWRKFHGIAGRVMSAEAVAAAAAKAREDAAKAAEKAAKETAATAEPAPAQG